MYVKFPNIRTQSKDFLNTSAPHRCPDASTDRATSTDAPAESDKSAHLENIMTTAEEFQATSPMVVDTEKNSVDQDTQEPSSQRE